jgi:uncharacterized protein
LPAVEIREYRTKELDLKGGTVIDGFPSIGLVSTIASNYLIEVLQLDCIAVLESELFPPLSMIFARKPKFPARIHASQEHGVAAFTAEFTPVPTLDRAIAKAMLGWAMRKGCEAIITSMGFPAPEAREPDVEPQLYGVGSTDSARKKLEEAGIAQLEMGMITGVPAVLLNEGKWENFDVIALLVQADPRIPDHRAAAKVVQAMNRLLPRVEVDVGPLLAEAEEIERRLRLMRSQAKVLEAHPQPTIYG